MKEDNDLLFFEKIEQKCSQWNASFKGWLTGMCPPGYEIKEEYRGFWTWWFISVGYSFLFFIRYYQAYRNLFYWEDKKLVLDTTKRMPQFSSLLGDSMLWFFLGIVLLVLVFCMHYAYYRRASKSIYVMKRLSDKRLLWKTYIQTPLVYGLMLLATAVCLLAVYYIIYLLVTPAECLIR